MFPEVNMVYTEEERRKLNELLSSGVITSDGTIDGIPNQTLAALMADNSEQGVQFTPTQFQQNEMDRNREQFARDQSPQPAPVPQSAPGPQNWIQKSGGPKISLDQFAQPAQPQGDQVLSRQRMADGSEVVYRRVMGIDGFGRQSSQVVSEVIPAPNYDLLKKQAEIANLNRQNQPKPEPAKWEKVTGDDGKTYRVNMTTGAMEPLKVGDEPFVEAAKDGKGKKGNMEGLGDIISQARALLTKTAPGQQTLPTESYMGSGLDAVAGWFGGALPGSAEADQLSVIGGALTSKMPRMEGPQSEYDVKLYQEMAGMVGDRTKPIERRLAALGQVEQLWAKYDKSWKPSASSSPSGKSLSPKDREALQWVQANPNHPQAAAVRAKLGM